jgi:ribosomal protein S18 acetylase RimI-like enzyme
LIYLTFLDKMHTNLNIRNGKQGDLPALEWGGDYTHFKRLFADAYQQVERGRAILWIAEIPEAGLIGQLFVSLNSYRLDLADGMTRAYLFGFRVRPAYRNEGVGTFMMHIVEADLVDRGFRQLTLNVGQENPAARNFYERLGYRVIGPDPGLWSYLDDRGQRVNVHEPAWRMIKDLLRE